MSKKRGLLWFTKDLRTHDNPLIDWPVHHHVEVMALAFAPKNKTAQAKWFVDQSIEDLRRKFNQQGIHFFVIEGPPEIEIPKWVEKNAIDLVLTQESCNSKDQLPLHKLAQVWGPDKLRTFRHQTLIAVEELPFSISDLPLVFTLFCKLIEKNISIKAPLDDQLAQLQGFKAQVPESSKLIDLGTPTPPALLPFELIPGETGALARLQEYFWQSRAIAHYKETRNGLLQKNDSSKMSPYLAVGALSPRFLFQELQKFEAKHGKNESTEWFLFELLWRDYFKFLALKIGPQLFSRQGLSSKSKSWFEDHAAFETWKHGNTQLDFVDANMIELLTTGWMSNRGRQNVASFLAKSLQIDWTWGAQYFEQSLIDDDTESNWGNWQYVAGVGTDPRDRIFNIQKQREMYDPLSEFCQKWLQQKDGAR